jgi:hypothetical protein
MVEIEGSTTCIYMSIRLLNVLGNRGVCGDTTRGFRAFVVLHAVIGVNDQHFQNILRTTGTCLPVVRCVPVNRQTRRRQRRRVAFFDLFEKVENPVP